MPQLCKSDRDIIEMCIKKGYPYREIAALIDVHPTTISREIKRNSIKGVYRAERAQRLTKYRHKEKPKRKYFTDNMRAFVESHLHLHMTPEQIAGLARIRFGFQFVSFQTIYKYIYEDKKRGGDLYVYLPHGKKRYRKRDRYQPKNKLDINERPDIINNRERFGDFEIDTVYSLDRKHGLVTLNDRMTGFLFASVTALTSEAVKDNTIKLLEPLKKSLHSITSDNGSEFVQYPIISERLGIDFYFCHPGKSWQRGSNENLNGLLRRFFPKKYEFIDMKPSVLSKAVNIINSRPRKRYEYYSPVELLLK